MAITLFTIVVLVMSVVIHEYAHGWVAYKLGDDTAKSLGRLTLNPIPHLDPMGSIFLPLILVLSNSSILLAWAKPVPYNPNNLTDFKYGELKVAIGGPISNFILALFFGTLARIFSYFMENSDLILSLFFQGKYNSLLSQMSGSLLSSFFVMSIIACFINLILMFFNLMPIPPLDGSKILMAFLPYEWQNKMRSIEPYGIFILMFLLFFGVISYIFIPIFFIFRLLVGF